MLNSVRIAWFFFSSRRRHTRCALVTESDVCSSDLRFIKDNTPVECWPLTDGPSATVCKSLLGGRDMEVLFDPDVDNGEPQKLSGGTLADWIEPETGRASCRDRGCPYV